MSLQEFLVDKFSHWSPPAPGVVNRTKGSITLDWGRLEPFQFIADQLLFRIEKNEKFPPWVVVYRGGKIRKEIHNLAPRHPHKFRLKVIVQADAVPSLADKAVQFYGSEDAVYETIAKITDAKFDDYKKVSSDKTNVTNVPSIRVTKSKEDIEEREKQDKGGTNTRKINEYVVAAFFEEQERSSSAGRCPVPKWIESQWSEETWTNTDTDGTSIMCFCMAVHCGYTKQGMLEERPELIGILNPTNGFTPLATAVRKGDINTVRFLLALGANVNQRSSTGQAPLHLAVLAGRLPIVDLLLERGADFQARDVNGLRAEHYAVDCGDVGMLRHILDKGGDVGVRDSNEWTPLFRALCQGANTAIIEELVVRGSDLAVADKAGLPLTSVARIVTNRHGRNRDSVLRLVDMSYPHEVAMQHFTRLTKKIYNVHTLLKLPSLSNKPNLRQ